MTAEPAHASPHYRPGGSPVLVVAADMPSAEQALVLAERLTRLPLWLKVGLELFAAEGPVLLKLLRGKGFNLFLDLKFHDIPNTVQGATRSSVLHGVSMLTLHLSGGEAMCRAAAVGRAEAMSIAVDRGGRDAAQRPLLMGVTVLTSEGGDEETIRSRVVKQALMAKDWGLDGVICSGREAGAVKEACGPACICACPGIRFADEERDDQARVCTPEQAVGAGADFVIMGRPVIRAEDPRVAAQQALDAMDAGTNLIRSDIITG